MTSNAAKALRETHNKPECLKRRAHPGPRIPRQQTKRRHIRERQTFSGDPVLYHHLTKFEKLVTDPPLWETWSERGPIRDGPPMIDSQGYFHSR